MLTSVMPLCCATSTTRNGGSEAASSATAIRTLITDRECKLRRVRAVCVFALLSLCPAPAAAQQDAFRDALIGFHAGLAGEKGDEGPQVIANLDRMAAAL